MRPDLLQVEAHHPVDGGQIGHEVEADGQPLAPFAQLHEPPFAADRDKRHGIFAVDQHFEFRGRKRRALQQRVRRTVDMAPHHAVLHLDVLDGPA